MISRNLERILKSYIEQDYKNIKKYHTEAIDLITNSHCELLDIMENGINQLKEDYLNKIKEIYAINITYLNSYDFNSTAEKFNKITEDFYKKIIDKRDEVLKTHSEIKKEQVYSTEIHRASRLIEILKNGRVPIASKELYKKMKYIHDNFKDILREDKYVISSSLNTLSNDLKNMVDFINLQVSSLALGFSILSRYRTIKDEMKEILTTQELLEIYSNLAGKEGHLIITEADSNINMMYSERCPEYLVKKLDKLLNYIKDNSNLEEEAKEEVIIKTSVKSDSNLLQLKYKNFNKMATENGYIEDRHNGDHAIFKNQDTGDIVVIPQRNNLGKGLRHKIFKDIHNLDACNFMEIELDEIEENSKELEFSR